MTLTNAMQTSLSGLRAAQAGLDVVSQNIANSGTVGYTRRTLVTTDLVAGGRTIGLDVKGASRTLDTLLQRQLRLEQAGGSSAPPRRPHDRRRPQGREPDARHAAAAPAPAGTGGRILRLDPCGRPIRAQ